MYDYKWKWVAVCFAVMLLAGLVYLFYEPRRYDVEFVVPDGFHGIFVIKEDRKSGLPPETTDSTVRYVIPNSGVLITTDTSPLSVWHAESARYSSDRQVENAPGTPEDHHILIQLTYDSLGRNTFLIGTQAEQQ